MNYRAPLSCLLMMGACALGACDTPVQPEPPPGCPQPCVPARVDLALLSLTILSPTSPGIRPTQKVVPELLRIGYVVRNEGDTAATAVVSTYFHGVEAQDSVPSLARGAEHTGELTLDLSRLSQLYTGGTDRLRVSVVGNADRTFSNNSLLTDTLYIARPRLTLANAGTAAEVRANEPFTLRIRVTNQARYTTSRPVTVVACLWDFYSGCRPDQRTTFGRFELPAVAPLGFVDLAFNAVVPSAAAWQDERVTYQLYFCDLPADPYLSWDEYCGVNTFTLTVRPDYTTCAPPLLVPGQQTTRTAHNCGLRPATSIEWHDAAATTRNRFHLVAFDVEAGRTYRIDRTHAAIPLLFYDEAGRPLADRDAATDRLRFDVTARVYIASYAPAPWTVTVTATQ